MKYRQLLRFYFEPNKCMRQHYWKAARKLRIRKKWLRRFGPDADIAGMVFNEDSFLSKIPRSDNWSGKSLPFPFSNKASTT